MSNLKDQILELIRNQANEKVAVLANRYPQALPEEREAILAAIEFERWTAEVSLECLDVPNG